MDQTLLRNAFATLLVMNLVGSAHAGPIDPVTDHHTLCERVAQADVVVVVKWLGGAPSTLRAGRERAFNGLRLPAHSVRPIEPHFERARTAYEVVEFLKGRDETFSVGGTVELGEYRKGERGEFQLLIQDDNATRGYDWVMASEAALEYVRRAPGRDAPPQERLLHYVRHLEHADPQIAEDAHRGASGFDFRDLTRLVDWIPHDLIRAHVADAEPSSSRLGLYGALLGLFGTEDDARVLERRIMESANEFRLGIDGIMSGYLLLTGRQGLNLIDRTKLASKHQLGPDGKAILDQDGKPLAVPFSESYAAMQALRFMWQYGENRISKDRLRQSMHILLDRPELADLAIADLARWKDWSVQERLIALYGKEGYDTSWIKRGIVRYLLACAKDRPESASGETPEHVAQAEKHLAELRARDPRIVRDAERLLK